MVFLCSDELSIQIKNQLITLLFPEWGTLLITKERLAFTATVCVLHVNIFSVSVRMHCLHAYVRVLMSKPWLKNRPEFKSQFYTY